MIEFPEFPAVWIMTVFAKRTQALLMDITTPVAIVARGRGLFIPGRKMAIFARGHRMPAQKGKLRLVMIEFYIFPPSLLVMTLIALFT